MEENNTKQQEEVVATQSNQKVETVQKESGATINEFSNNLILENQKKMVLQIEALEKKLNEAKKSEQQTLAILREKENQEKARIQAELVNRALNEFPILSNAKEVAVNLIKNKLSFDDKQNPLWDNAPADEAALKTNLESFFKENSFLLDKSVKQTSVVQNSVKQQPGVSTIQKDLSSVEGINAFLKARRGMK